MKNLVVVCALLLSPSFVSVVAVTSEQQIVRAYARTASWHCVEIRIGENGRLLQEGCKP